MTDQKRKYQKRARAEQEEATRRRITESAVELHGTLGPARTSMSAVAEHAGVPRSTLYRHFPDEGALFVACSAHWAAQHPVPDVQAWAAVADPDERLRRALGELYAYYEGAEPMISNILRDLDVVAAVQTSFAPFQDYLAAARDALLAGRGRRGRAARRTRAAIGHAISFPAWRSLALEQQCSRADAVDLMCGLVAAASV